MNLESLKIVLDSMKSNGKIRDYYIKRTSCDWYELEVHHYINNKIYCVLMDFDYEYSNVEYEIERLKESMVENYIEYLKGV